MSGFEERLARLEELAGKMRDRDVPLEEAMALFDEGAALSKQLEEELQGFERKVEKLANLPPAEGGGEVQLEEF